MDGILSALKTDLLKGVSSSSIRQRKISFGENVSSSFKSNSSGNSTTNCMVKIIQIVLVTLSLLYLTLGIIRDSAEGWHEGLGILIAAIILIILTKTYREKSNNSDFSEYLQESCITAIRDGNKSIISSFDLVVGDIVQFKIGDIIPVDALILCSEKIIVDESAITGNFKQAKKNSSNNPFLLSGSYVCEGVALCVVLAVGQNSCYGINFDTFKFIEKPRSLLKMKIDTISKIIANAGLIAAILIFLVLLGYQFYDVRWEAFNFELSIKNLIIATAISIITISESFSIAILLCSNHACSKMLFDYCIVRRVEGLELLSQVTSICTGVDAIINEDRIEIKEMCIGKDDIYENANKNDIEQEVINYIGYHFCHNTLVTNNSEDNENFQTSNRIEKSLVKVAKDWGFDYEKIRNKERVKLQIPFNPAIKKMYTVVEEDGIVYVFIKGAAEYIVDICSKYISKGGHTHELDKQEKEEIKKNVISNFAKKAYKPLGCAYKIVKKGDTSKFLNEDGSPNIEALERKMILLGVFGIGCQLRPGTAETIVNFQKAGIIVRLVTGNHPETAFTLAKECHIINQNYIYNNDDDTILTGEEFRKRVGKEILMSKINPRQKSLENIEAFKKIISKLKVLASCTLQDKQLLMIGLKQLKEVVVTTGSDNSDIPAMNLASMSFSLHNICTEVTQKKSDFALLNSSINPIVTAMIFSLNIYECMRKIVQFKVAIIIVELSIIVVGVVYMNDSPLTVIQLFWVSLILDTFASLGFAYESPKYSILKEKPSIYSGSFINVEMIKTIVGQVIYQLFWLIFILFTHDEFKSGFFFDIYNFGENCKTEITIDQDAKTIENQICSPAAPTYKFTLLFQTFFVMQVFNIINCRSIKFSELNAYNLMTNMRLLICLLLIFIAQICFVQFGGNITQCSPMGFLQHCFCICIGIGALIFGFIFRLVPTSIFSFLSADEEKKIQ